MAELRAGIFSLVRTDHLCCAARTRNIDDVFELYSVPSEGGTPVKLNAAMVDGGEVSDGFQFSPDGSRVLYTSRTRTRVGSGN